MTEALGDGQHGSSSRLHNACSAISTVTLSHRLVKLNRQRVDFTETCIPHLACLFLMLLVVLLWDTCCVGERQIKQAAHELDDHADWKRYKTMFKSVAY